ncbi:MAG TPA: M20/M25/M40 family metallo-hydrolase [Candidatus Binatia bacterium]|jgi:acetylornithine deacetylase/succinyl-diaminopimelate desuccinylase-like protein
MQNSLETVLTQINEERLINLARNLVDIPSTTGEERECAEFLVNYMREVGLKASRQDITETRANAIGILKGSGEGPVLMFNGHLDTAASGIEEEDYPVIGPVPAGYKPKSYRKNGYIFGLGANNMKGGVAAAVSALETLVRAGIKPKGDVMVTGVAGESEKSPVEGAIRSYRGARYQGGGYGTRYLITHCQVPDYAVVCEPSSCLVVNAQTGYFFVKLALKGKMAGLRGKGSDYAGINAIEKASVLVDRLKQWDLDYSQRHRYDSGMGIMEPHLNVGAIEGGWPFKPSYSVAICNLYIDLRVTPAMNPMQALHELEGELRKISASDPQLKYDIEVYASNVPATTTPPDNYLVQTSLRARELVVGQKQERFPLGQANLSNDSNIFRQHGIPAVKCGPAGGTVPANAQGLLDEGERLSIEELVTAAKIYVAIALDICT